jgi:hypothetical protein
MIIPAVSTTLKELRIFIIAIEVGIEANAESLQAGKTMDKRKEDKVDCYRVTHLICQSYT